MQPYFPMLESVTVARSFVLITQNIENALLTFTLDMEKASNQRLFMKTQKKEPQDFPHGSRKKKKTLVGSLRPAIPNLEFFWINLNPEYLYQRVFRILSDLFGNKEPWL